jgi:hypothetical protein
MRTIVFAFLVNCGFTLTQAAEPITPYEAISYALATDRWMHTISTECERSVPEIADHISKVRIGWAKRNGNAFNGAQALKRSVEKQLGSQEKIAEFRRRLANALDTESANTLAIAQSHKGKDKRSYCENFIRITDEAKADIRAFRPDIYDYLTEFLQYKSR